ncbi:scarecrow-like protein 11 [Selaginella moellendorffii]|nr:scarecrow-like protein 11 [Selaginella moellendorffii]XP_024544325.1 scarecrow-like protein 11 [Selaginella moellendorffii]|eukprot:XP_024544324.1 scarecrow-like protein 11 [Selaginella moellendorffii]
MADKPRANGASSSSMRELVSPLAIKLQQVWLQTQFRPSRDSNAAVDLPLPSPGGAAGSVGDVGNFSPSPPTLTSPVNAAAMAVAGTPSSSSESGDDSWGCVAMEPRVSGVDENAVLQYIDSMLMENQIGEQACLDLEVSVGALQAELAELIQTSPPEVSPNLDWRSDISSSAGYGASQPSPSQLPPAPQGSSSRRNSPSSLLGSWTSQPSFAVDNPSTSSLHHHQENTVERNRESLQPSPSLKKRSHGETSASGSGFQMVGFFERQNLFGLDWNGRSNGIAAAGATTQGFPNRPPRLIVQRSENYTRLWDRMGLRSHLLDKLVLCGEAVWSDDFGSALAIMEELREQAGPEGDATQRVVHYFLHALNARMSNTGSRFYSVMCKARPSIAETLKAVQMILKHTPFLGLPHFFTNQIILEAIKGERKVHIVDFGIMYGLQWPALLQLLAERKEGPPQLRITGVDLPPRALNNHSGRIRETGSRLKRCAQDWGIPFKFRSLSCAWESMEPGLLQLKDDEVLIISCSFKQTNLFDGSVIAESPKLQWLTRIRNLHPKVFIQSLASSNFAGPIFLQRFQEALVHHAAVFAAMDACISRMLPERRVIEQDKYGREIMNIIACEGLDRVERSETHQQWHHLAVKAGLEVMPLSPALFEESKAFARFYNRDLTVNRDGEWMWLGWRDQIIHAYSAWRAAT